MRNAEVNIIKSGIEFLKGNDEATMLKNLERVARTCYKSEGAIKEGSDRRLIKTLFNRNHMSIMDHESISYVVTCDRGVTHEIVRHRLAAYAQESTRYCNYSFEKFGSKISVIDIGSGFNYDLTNTNDLAKYNEWLDAMEDAQRHYFNMLNLGATPEEARSVLPNSLKTEIVITMDITAWIHFIDLRADAAAHPQMREVANMIRTDLIERYPYLLGECAHI